MRDFEITIREILVSIVIVLLMIGLGFFIAESIHDKITSDSEVYFKSLKVNKDQELFDYAIRTEVGDMLSFGKFKAYEPVSDSLINGKFFAINKVEEHYTMHTRTVSYKCGKSTCTRTETYWTWDYVGETNTNTKTFTYLGKKFDFETVNFNNEQFFDTVDISSDDRFQFYVIPIEFNGTLYSKAKDKTIKENKLYSEQTIKQVIDNKKHSADFWVNWFWFGWGVLIVILVAVFMLLDNKYINNN